MVEGIHPLEGKYIVYKFSEGDHGIERCALALFQLTSGEMKKIYHPDFCYPFGEIDEDESNEKFLAEIGRRRITSVYSVFHRKDFFGIPAGWVSLDGEDKEGEEAMTWFEYEPVCRRTYESDLLKKVNVELLFHMED